jgi:hypothetical protein
MSSTSDWLNSIGSGNPADAPPGGGQVYVNPRPPALAPDTPPAPAADLSSPRDWLTGLTGSTPAAAPPAAPKQSWKDWLYENAITKPMSASSSDWIKANADDLTGGLGAYPISWLTGRPVQDIRKEFESAQGNLGFGSQALNAVDYAVGPMGRVLGPIAGAAKLGGLGTSMLEGNLAGWADRLLHGDTNPMDYVKSGVAGATGGAIAHGVGESVINPTVRFIGDKIFGLPGRAGDTQFPTERDAFQSGNRGDLDAVAQQAKTQKAAIAQNAKGQPSFTPDQTEQMERWSNLQNAANRTDDPGYLARGIGGLTGAAGGYAAAHLLPGGLPEIVGNLGNIVLGVTGLGGGVKWGGGGFTRGVNSLDRNVAGQRALDDLYQQQTGRQVTTNTPDYWHQFGVGWGTR